MNDFQEQFLNQSVPCPRGKGTWNLQVARIDVNIIEKSKVTKPKR